MSAAATEESIEQRLASLHDAELVSLELVWRTGEVLLRLAAITRGPATIVVGGVRRFEGAREAPWGPSVYVYAAKLVTAPAGGVGVELEMQTGDVLRVVGTSVRWDAA